MFCFSKEKSLILYGLWRFANAYFKDKCEETLPFGKAPWPCRNHICEHFLRDVIESIELRCEKGRYKAIFTCPHCGMVYRRKHPVPKEMQYTGEVYISNYGWKWKECLKQHFQDGSTTKAMMRELHCDYYTVKKYGVPYGFLPTDQRLRKYPNHSKDMRETEDVLSWQEERDRHRKRWLAVISENLCMSRKQLFNIEHKSYLWLMENDSECYEANTSAKRNTGVDWRKRDKEYLEMVVQAIVDLKEQPGRPRLLSLSLIKRQIGIGNLHIYLNSGKLPETSAYLEQHIETQEEWRKRKAYWAVQEFKKCDTHPNMRDIMIKAGIAPKWFVSLEEYVSECMKHSYEDIF